MRIDTLSIAESPKHILSTKRSWQQTVALLMLVAAILAVYLPSFTSKESESVALAANTFAYHTDLDYWRKTERARNVVTTMPLDLDHQLDQLPLQIGDWKGVEREETNQEVNILLDPEQYVLRLYQNGKGQYIWLSLIGARSSQAFHPPDICYDADGWQYDMGSHNTQLTNGGEIFGLLLNAQKNVDGQPSPVEHVVYYFYLFPNDNRNLADGIILFKLTSARYGSLAETMEVQDDFVRQFFLSAQE